ncbi:MAG: dethiobiotin synthase [Anaerosolibacter sp.]|jgi:dethiobiotin synthetase|uniref:dethiobiotin synthase n=1 Tax=Anaerosolibacter sp. TaxID=1872527 RepID=UPI0026157DFE|nr:dethiobiotin synthase [Anaerosolibacter sp.]MDF2547510.1 dethiobiotin synthase [Anaerosolibacter sp.]
MAKGVFIIGTDTDVGKSVITAGLVYLLRRHGYNGVSYKAVQSGGIEENGRLISADARFVNNVAGLDESLERINGYCLKTPVSPHLAAQLEGVKLEKPVILKKYQWLCGKYDYVIAEGSGGLVVPLIDEGYMVYDFAKDLDLPVLVVSRTGVGTINHTMLTVKYAQAAGLRVKGMIMNGYKGSAAEEDNVKMVQKLTGLPVVGVIDRLEDVDVEKGTFGKLKEEFERKIDIQVLLEMMEDAKEVSIHE